MTWPEMNWLFDTLRSYLAITAFLVLTSGFCIEGLALLERGLGRPRRVVVLAGKQSS